MIKNKNNILILFIFIFMLISITTIYSAMTYLSNSLGNLVLKQIMWYIVGFGFIFFISRIDNKNIFNYSWYFYILNVILLLILLFVASPINGSKCWFILPGIGSFQPSEFMKISLLFSFSLVLDNWIKKINNKPTFKNEIGLLSKLMIIFLIPSILIFLEPDTGSILIYMIILLSILLVSPFRKRWFILGMVLISLMIGAFLWLYFFNQELFVEIFGTDLFYRIDRILDWKNGTGMQLENSLVAIGSSGLLGHGYNNTPIYFPESGTDFIFSVFASNFGLVGSILFILVLLCFDLYLVSLIKRTDVFYEKFFIAGALGMFLYQQIQNIGMTLGLLPITGITLPFISYGGSSLLSYLIIIGIILNTNNKKTIN